MAKRIMLMLYMISAFFVSLTAGQQNNERSAGVAYTVDFEGENSTILLSPVFFDKMAYAKPGAEAEGPLVDELQDHSVFESSEEWKHLAGDELPSGVDVKINLKTGEKVVKPSADDANGTSVSRKPKKLLHAGNDTVFTFAELKKGLKALKKGESRKKKKKHYFENVAYSTEALKKLLKTYARSEVKEKLDILEELEFLVHQYNVATDFVKIGGVHILLPDMLSKNFELQSLVSLVLGSAMQGNPPVQQAVFRTDAMLQILLAFHSANNTDVKSRALYALANLIRHYPEAQLKFVKLGGFFMITDVFHPERAQRLKLKVVDLVHDLATERLSGNDDDIDTEGSYESFSFSMEKVVKENGYCSYIPQLLFDPEYDAHERALRAMNIIAAFCRKEFSTIAERLNALADMYRNALLDEFSEYVKEYKSLEGLDISDLYFFALFNSVRELIQALETGPDVSLT